MAPEVLMNKGIRRRADIWSLGCVVLEMAVGGNPWGNESFDNNFQAILKIADPSKMPPIPEHLSVECKDFIFKCLNRDYDKRPTAA
jgi:serine/threonine protein kinase